MDQPSLKAVLGQAQAFFASKGLRFTKQREAVTTLWFVAFESLGEAIAKNARKGDQLIVQAHIRANNWTILHLVESGMLREISLGGGERLYDPNFLQSPHHNHLVCVDCRKIVEFEDPNLDIMQNCITRRMGFSPTEKALRIEGRCDLLRLLGSCKNLQSSSKPSRRSKQLPV